MQLVLLVVLSPLITSFYSSNIGAYFFLLLIICLSNFTLETMYNSRNYEQKTKAKQMALFTVPMNAAILITFMVFIFD